MDHDLERMEASFISRAEQWISKQGLLFSLRNSVGMGSIMPRIYSLLIRLVILAVIGLAITWYILANRPSKESFREEVEEKIIAAMGASDGNVKNVGRKRGGLMSADLWIASIELKPSESSFYESWFGQEQSTSLGNAATREIKRHFLATGVTLSPMKLGDGLWSGWSMRSAQINHLELKIKVGAESDTAAMQAYSQIFKPQETLKLQTISVQETDIYWGYDESSAGKIEKAKTEITRKDGNWVLGIEGGTFSHGWLKNASIVSMQVTLAPDGTVTISDAELTLGKGMLKFEAVLNVAASPSINGTYEFEKVGVLDLIGEKYSRFFNGTLEGSGTLTGKLNTAEGLITTTKVHLSEDSPLIIRNVFPILQTLRNIDNKHSYHLMKCEIGSFVVRHAYGNTKISDISVRSDNLIHLKGELTYALPTKIEDEDIGSINSDSNSSAQGNPEFDDAALIDESTMFKVFKGNLSLGLLRDVFISKPWLYDIYPIDKETSKVWLNIELEGDIESVSSNLSEKMDEEAKEKK